MAIILKTYNHDTIIIHSKLSNSFIISDIKYEWHPFYFSQQLMLENKCQFLSLRSEKSNGCCFCFEEREEGELSIYQASAL